MVKNRDAVPDSGSRGMPVPEFSRITDVSGLDDGCSEQHRLSAGEAERAALARRFGVAQLNRLEVEAVLTRRGRQVHARLALVVEATQTCVVSLETVPVSLRDVFEQVFDPDVRPTGEFDETIDLDPGSDDPPDPMTDDRIDLGEVAAERFGLTLDPYPRKPGALLDARHAGGDDGGSGGRPDNPFAALGKLRPDG